MTRRRCTDELSRKKRKARRESISGDRTADEDEKH